MLVSKNSFTFKKPDMYSFFHFFFSALLTFINVAINIPVIQSAIITWGFGHYFDLSQIYMPKYNSPTIQDWAMLERKLFASEQKYDFTDTFIFNLLGCMAGAVLGYLFLSYNGLY